MPLKSPQPVDGNDLISTFIRLGDARRRLEAAQGPSALGEVRTAYADASSAVHRVTDTTLTLGVEVGEPLPASQQRRTIPPW